MISNDIKNPCVIVDVDGTVANNDHRIHLIQSKPKKWQAFFDASADDVPIEPVKLIVNLVYHFTNVSVVIMTARDSAHKELTEDWLKKHDIRYDHFYCRTAKDKREDFVVKREILEQIKADGFTPIMAFEDRKQVKRMFEAEGLFVFDVNQTDSVY